jgi:nicotinamidase-related amidase
VGRVCLTVKYLEYAMDRHVLDNERSHKPTREDTALVVVDFQGSLFSTMDEAVGRRTLAQTTLLIEGAHILGLPIVVTEQYPAGLGVTMPEVQRALGDGYRPLAKLSFSLMGDRAIFDEIAKLDRENLILCGMETHVCVLQSALDLLEEGFIPFVAADAVCSRQKLDWEIGLSAAADAGAEITSAETILFTLFGAAGTDAFRAFARLLKDRARTDGK